jgi:dolichol-phosphate mannosyltransferase
MQLDIIMPVFDEDKVIERTLKKIKANVKTPYNVFIIYDYDEDTTLPKVHKFLKEMPLITIKNGYGRGVLNAIKTGFEKSRADYKVIVMADLSDRIETIDEMYEKAEVGAHDIVCGSRYMKGGRHIGGPKLKRILSRIAGRSLHLLTGIPTHDITNAFKLYSKKVVREITIESTGGFEYSMEIVIKAYNRGFRISEVPTEWTDRTGGESKFQMKKWLLDYLYWYCYAVCTIWLKKIAILLFWKKAAIILT